MPFVKPVRRLLRGGRRAKIVMPNPSRQALLDAAEAARYISNPYHRSPGSPMGQPVGRPYPHASKCPRSWDLARATSALKQAIREGVVSPEWRDGFPQSVWYRNGETIYEAVLSNRTTGEYHAYPLESRDEWPKGL